MATLKSILKQYKQSSLPISLQPKFFLTILTIRISAKNSHELNGLGSSSVDKVYFEDTSSIKKNTITCFTFTMSYPHQQKQQMVITVGCSVPNRVSKSWKLQSHKTTL
jgi:hypothetical protein